jgi:hypothetical protein
MARARTSERPVVSLVPQSGIQFLDFELDIDTLPKTTRSFWEERIGSQVDSEGKVPVLLRVLQFDEQANALVDPVTGQHPPESEIYQFNRVRGLEPHLDKWVPVPVLRVRARGQDGAPVYDQGPTNWARVRVTEVKDRTAGGPSHRVTLAFDTALRPREEGRPYVAPSVQDSAEEQEFAFVADERHNAWFLNEAWVDQWLDELLREMRQAQRGGRALREEDFPHTGEHWARYLTFLGLLADAQILPRIKLIDAVSQHRRYVPIDVDLVLDVGNSRTCGILVEYNPDERMNFNDSYVLKLRDLGRPEQVYERPFESKVEFARAHFGKDVVSRRSGRGNAFYWPSPVRVGPEAVRLATEALGNEGMTGLSSPKRYLWDERAVSQGWRFNGMAGDGVTTEPPVSGPFMAHLTEEGEVLRQVRRGQPAVRPRFSRSSMYTLLLAEILMQAVVQINAPANRGNRRHAEVPRRLRRVVLTMPPAMPLAEQRVARRRTEAAIKLTWDLLGWSEGAAHAPPEPRAMLNLDEATATQLVYLYTEATQRFQGDIEALFQLIGRVREGYGAQPCLRVASIDIGGGTTDLMVTTFTVEGSQAINPQQNFREGFKLAGDDILAAVIERIVVPPILDRLKATGAPDAKALVRTLVGGDFGGQSELERHLRRQFVTQVLEPVGLDLLHAYESAKSRAPGELYNRSFREVLGATLTDRLAGFLQEPAHAAGARGFDLAEVRVSADWTRIDTVVRSVMRQILGDLCEVVHAYDCDILLLSGRPSRLAAVQDTVLAKLPVMPDRIVPMYQYYVGGWYPFRDANARIADPKTTAAVGAMLAALAEGHLEGFLLRTSKLRMKSTARFIGKMDISGQIKRDSVLLSEIDLDRARDRNAPQEFEVDFLAPIFLGFRQLGIERWPATPLYYMEYSNPDSVARVALPLKVRVERAALDEDSPEEMKEDFVITEIEDATGSTLRKTDVMLRLQTIRSEAGYWRDTGVLQIA